MKTSLNINIYLSLLALFVCQILEAQKTHVVVVRNYDKSIYSETEKTIDNKKHGWTTVYDRNGTVSIKYYKLDTLLKSIELNEAKDTVKHEFYKHLIDPVTGNKNGFEKYDRLSNDSLLRRTIYTYDNKDSIVCKHDSSGKLFCENVIDTCRMGNPVDYLGGEEHLSNSLGDNLKYPKNCRKEEITGIVWVMFTVDTSGNITDINAIGPYAHPDLEKEALRVVSLTNGKWIPGTYCNKKVKSVCRIPITFEIEDDF